MRQRSDKVQIAHNALRWNDKDILMKILDSVNISPFERQLVIDTELSRLTLKELADKHNMSYSALVRHKRRAMTTIADYILHKTKT
jgi:DNA-directed RNA polymerase specialized sigma24 family protein